MIYKMSHPGAYHVERHEENQDCVDFVETEGRYSAILLADGASTCEEAKTGAEMVCAAVRSQIQSKAELLFHSSGSEAGKYLLDYSLFEIRKCARDKGKSPFAYACTLSTVMFDAEDNRLLYINLGDNMILASGKNGCCALSKLQRCTDGTCVITTRNAKAVMQADIIGVNRNDVETVFIFSDGAWKTMFQRSSIVSRSGEIDVSLLKPEVYSMLSKKDFEGLKTCLKDNMGADDCSFIAMSLNRNVKR